MKQSAYVLSIDQGTTGSRAIIYDSKGKVVGQAYREIKQYYPHPGWVEQDPLNILESVQWSIQRAISISKISKNKIVSIGITNQRESVVVWNKKSGKPYHRVIVWQDRRSSPICERLKKAGKENAIHRKTGLLLDPYFSGTKLTWLFQNSSKCKEAIKKGSLIWGTIDSWLLWNLTGVHATDYTNASRTLLFDIKKKIWSKELFKLFKVPAGLQPKVCDSGGLFGKTDGFKVLPDGIPVMSIIGDQQSALYGQGCYEKGSMKNTYGTGCFLLMNTGRRAIISKSGLLTTMACDSSGKPAYALEGAIFVAGALVQWLRDSLGFIKEARETESKALSVPDSMGVTVVPAFVGLGAPYWDSAAKGAILGLTRGVKREHIIRASLESIAFQTKDLVNLINKEFKNPIKTLKVDGGVSQNNFLMQYQSDILGIPVLRSNTIESTAWGTAKLAGIKAGIWKSAKALDLKVGFNTYHPKMLKKKREEQYSYWQSQVKRVFSSSEK